jgi:hypothetical protein
VRVAELERTREIIAAAERLPGKNVVVTGARLPQIEALLGSPTHGQVEFVYLLDTAEVERYRREDYAIYYLRGQREFNLDVHGVDIGHYGQLFP